MWLVGGAQADADALAAGLPGLLQHNVTLLPLQPWLLAYAVALEQQGSWPSTGFIAISALRFCLPDTTLHLFGMNWSPRVWKGHKVRIGICSALGHSPAQWKDVTGQVLQGCSCCARAWWGCCLGQEAGSLWGSVASIRWLLRNRQGCLLDRAEGSVVRCFGCFLCRALLELHEHACLRRSVRQPKPS